MTTGAHSSVLSAACLELKGLMIQDDEAVWAKVQMTPEADGAIIAVRANAHDTAMR